MFCNAVKADFQLIYVVVNFGLGSKIMHTAKKCGILGGTIYLGRGTVSNKILKFLAITDIRKEILMMGASAETVNKVIEVLDKEYKFAKPNHGIVFTTPVCGVIGARYLNCDQIKEESEEVDTMYHNITVVVDKGKAEFVIDAATKAGSRGGTIVNARGSGIHETSKVFNMDIEPEKELVMILSEGNKTRAIVESIRDHLKMDQPGNGVIFVQEVNRVFGLYE